MDTAGDTAVRAFIAIELDRPLLQSLIQVQRKLQAEPAGRWVRWVAPEGIHLTLKFLGPVDRRRIPDLQAVLAAATAGLAPFELVARGLGGFPNTNRPNNVWVGVAGAVETAAQLAERLEEGCARLGLAREERGFSPHLTLGRVKRDARPADRVQVGEMIRRRGGLEPAEVGRLRVDRVYLMQSDLRPAGAIYSVLGSARLDAIPGSP